MSSLGLPQKSKIEGQKSKIGRTENGEMMEKCKIEKILISLIFVWLRGEKWKDRKSEFI